MQETTSPSLIDRIDSLIVRSGAWDNEFFKFSGQHAFSPEHVLVFAPEYLYVTKAFPKILLKLAARIDNEQIQSLIVQILYSELGCSDINQAHSKLFVELMKAAGLTDQQAVPRAELSETRALVEGLEKIYSEDRLPVALGAQYALEHQADNMLRRFSDGFRGMNLGSRHLKFFAVHEDEEPVHIRLMTEALVDLVEAGEDESLIQDGASKCVELFADFWNGLHKAIVDAGATRAGSRHGRS